MLRFLLNFFFNELNIYPRASSLNNNAVGDCPECLKPDTLELFHCDLPFSPCEHLSAFISMFCICVFVLFCAFSLPVVSFICDGVISKFWTFMFGIKLWLLALTKYAAGPSWTPFNLLNNSKPSQLFHGYWPPVTWKGYRSLTYNERNPNKPQSKCV